MEWKYLLGIVAGVLLIVYRDPIASTVANTEETLLSMVQKRHEEQRERKYRLGQLWSAGSGILLIGICLYRLLGLGG